MQYFLLYLCYGVLFGLIEFISVLFIRDGGAIWLKAIYGLISVVAWPLMILMLFVPKRVLCKWRRLLDG